MAEDGQIREERKKEGEEEEECSLFLFVDANDVT